jgi:hypothetical protein
VVNVTCLRRSLPETPEGPELALRAFDYFGVHVVYDGPASLAQIPVGER